MATPVFVTGIQGRISVNQSGTVSNIAGLKSWKMTKNTAEVPLAHFEIALDNIGNMWEGVLQGLSSATVEGEGFFDTANPDDTTYGLTPGNYVILSLIIVKNTPFGFNQVPVMISKIDSSSNVENAVASFSFSSKVNGNPGYSGLVTG